MRHTLHSAVKSTADSGLLPCQIVANNHSKTITYRTEKHFIHQNRTYREHGAGESSSLLYRSVIPSPRQFNNPLTPINPYSRYDPRPSGPLGLSHQTASDTVKQNITPHECQDSTAPRSILLTFGWRNCSRRWRYMRLAAQSQNCMLSGVTRRQVNHRYSDAPTVTLQSLLDSK